MTDAYEQIRIEPDCVQYSGFATPYRTFESNVMQQGDCNAPSTLQRVVAWVFRERIGMDVHAWFDDIFTGTNTIEEHNERLLWVYSRLKAERLYISRKKFDPFAPVLDILGCKVDTHGVHADSDKLAKLREWRGAIYHTEMLRFLVLLLYLSPLLPKIIT